MRKYYKNHLIFLFFFLAVIIGFVFIQEVFSPEKLKVKFSDMKSEYYFAIVMSAATVIPFVYLFKALFRKITALKVYDAVLSLALALFGYLSFIRIKCFGIKDPDEGCGILSLFFHSMCINMICLIAAGVLLSFFAESSFKKKILKKRTRFLFWILWLALLIVLICPVMTMGLVDMIGELF